MAESYRHSYETDVISDTGILTIRTISLEGAEMESFLGQLQEADFEFSLPESRPELAIARVAPAGKSTRKYPLPDLWSPDVVASLMDSAATSTVDDALTSGVVSVELSPMRPRRLTTLPLVGIWALAEHDLVVLIFVGLAAIINWTGIPTATREANEEFIKDWWSKKLGDWFK